MSPAAVVQRSTAFNRPPRSWMSFPKETVEVPAPPQLPTPPQKPQLILLLLPAFTMGVMALGTALFALLTPGNKTWWLSLLMLTGAVASPLAQMWLYRNSHKAWQKEVEAIEHEFESELRDLEDRLVKLGHAQLDGGVKLNPPVAHLRERAGQRNPRLWERRPRDADFLDFRIGLYEGQPTYTIKFLETDLRDPRKKRANETARPFLLIPNYPCTFSLPALGSVGIAGKAGFRSALTRTVLCNLAVHHSPAEVRLFAVIEARGDQVSVGAWIKWLPHTRAANADQLQIASTPAAIHRLMTQLLEELHRREQFLRNRERTEGSAPWPYLVILVENLDLVRGQEALNLVLKRGLELRAGCLFLAESTSQIPNGCGARLEADPEVKNGFVLTPDNPDQPVVRGMAELVTDLQIAETLARSLAPLDYAAEQGVELPAGINLRALYGVTAAHDLDLRAIWDEHTDPNRQLTAPIGQAVGNRLLELDLHNTAHGTHGLIAGMPGAGKTVLLSTVIASLAVANGPRLVNFVIIDMKGDANLSLLSQLPHTVGFASVLDKSLPKERIPSYIQRAITALRSEIDRRMQILTEANVTEIFEYNRRNPRRPLPHLLVIVDEFRVLKTQAPDLMDKLVDVAGLGRAPGVHLILCTQSPSGVVNEKIWANSQFRICLRVANADESRSMLHLPDAANLPVNPPGRAYLQASGGEVDIFEMFQVAHAGGRINGSRDQDSVAEKFEIAEIWPDGTRQVIYTHSPALQAAADETKLPTELEYIVQRARILAQDDGLSLPLPGPWLPPLPEALTLASLLAQFRTHRTWERAQWSDPDPVARLKVLLGMLDAPAAQRQDPLVLDLLREPHVWICGTVGSGKLLTLRTLIMSLAHTHTPDEVCFYLLAFGGGGLSPLAKLPHVGDLLRLNEVERLQRLMSLIEQEIADRSQLLNQAGVDSLEDYRRVTGNSKPAWVIVVEDFGKLIREVATVVELQDVVDRIAKFLSAGTACDIHFVFSTTAPNLYREMAGSINQRLALRLSDKGDYGQMLTVRPAGSLDEILGRGYWRVGNEAVECQIAAPTATVDESQQAAALSATIEVMDRTWTALGGARPKRVDVLPPRLPLDQFLSVPAEAAWRRVPEHESLPLVLGWGDDLHPLEVDLVGQGPSFLIVGAPQSGKTGLLETLALSTAVCYSPETVWLYGIDLKGDRLARTLSGLSNTQAVAETPAEALALLDSLLLDVQGRATRFSERRRTGTGLFGSSASASQWPRLVLLIDNFIRELSRDNQENTDLLQRLEQCSEMASKAGLHFVVAGDGAGLASLTQPFIQRLRASQRGFIFVKASDNAHTFNNVRVQRLPAKNALPGRAFFVQPTGNQLMQIGVFDKNASTENVEIKQWLNRLRQDRKQPLPEVEPIQVEIGLDGRQA